MALCTWVVLLCLRFQFSYCEYLFDTGPFFLLLLFLLFSVCMLIVLFFFFLSIGWDRDGDGDGMAWIGWHGWDSMRDGNGGVNILLIFFLSRESVCLCCVVCEYRIQTTEYSASTRFLLFIMMLVVDATIYTYYAIYTTVY